jgi:hypothetical protein
VCFVATGELLALATLESEPSAIFDSDCIFLGFLCTVDNEAATFDVSTFIAFSLVTTLASDVGGFRLSESESAIFVTSDSTEGVFGNPFPETGGGILAKSWLINGGLEVSFGTGVISCIDFNPVESVFIVAPVVSSTTSTGGLESETSSLATSTSVTSGREWLERGC